MEEAGVRTKGVANSAGVTKVVAAVTTEVVNGAGAGGGAGAGAGGRDGGVGRMGGVSGMAGVARAESAPIALSVGKNSLIPACLDMAAGGMFGIPLYTC